MSITGEQIAAEAKTFINVRFLHQGRDRNGVDCVGLLVCIARNLGVEVVDLEGYNRTPSASKLKEMIEANMIEIPLTEARIGDSYLMRLGGAKPRHMAIISEDRTNYVKGIEPKVIHALSSPTVDKVCEQKLVQYVNDIVAAYRFTEDK